MTHQPLTAEHLRSVLNYDADTGMFRWLRIRSGNGRRPGGVAGTLHPTGYIHITIDRIVYRAHRLAWFHTFGDWPAGEIDHRNGRRNDNRMANLREATHQQNSHNRKRPHRGNDSGYLGVSHHQNGRWAARITIDGHSRHLGLFNTPSAASAAYTAAKREAHPFWQANTP